MSTSEPPEERPVPERPSEQPTEQPAGGQPGGGQPGGEQPGRRRWSPRRRWLVGGAVVAVLLVVAAVLVGIARHDRFGPAGAYGGPGYGGPWHGGPGHGGPGHGRPGHAAVRGELPGDGLDVGPDGAAPGPGRERGPGGPYRGAGPLAGTSALVGSVSSADGGNLVVTADGGGQVSVPTSDRTRVLGEQKRTVGDLKPGDRVVVRVGGDRAAVAVIVAAARASGTVTALEGDRATLTRPNGLTEVVDVSALATKPKVGDVVVVQGGVADNGGTLKAQTLRELPKAG